MNYKLVKKIYEIEDYLKNHNLLALDIETAPLEKYRGDDRAALDSNKSKIVGLSLSIKEGTGDLYPPLPLRARKRQVLRSLGIYQGQYFNGQKQNCGDS